MRIALLAGSVLAMASPGMAADVTPERFLNADKETQNWLMSHRTYDGPRYSPLARISRDNIRKRSLSSGRPKAGPGGSAHPTRVSD